jgi:DNA uptake protein ComE-like DNA-binding protein
MAKKIEGAAEDPRLRRIEGIGGQKVHLNDADRDELQQIDGIDGVRAEQLIEQRERSGGLHSWDEIAVLPAFDDLVVDSLRMRATLA